MSDVPPTAAHEPGSAAHLVIVGAVLLDSLVVDGADGHHLARVRRLRAGEHLTVADGAGRWRRYEITQARPGTLALDAIGDERVEAPPVRSLLVAPALSKGTKLESVAAHLTELGVAEIAPVVLERSIVHLDEAGRRRLHERLTETVRLAAMQARRSRLPVVHEPSDLDLDRLTDRRRMQLVVAQLIGAPHPGLAPGPLAVVTGPEGGFSPDEITQFAQFDGVLLGLGEFVLRAETAPLAAAVRLLG